MNDIITILEEMASDSTLNTEQAITTLVAESNISLQQKHAIVSNNTSALIESTDNLPEIKCFAIIPAEDDEPESEENKDENNDDKINNCA